MSQGEEPTATLLRTAAQDRPQPVRVRVTEGPDRGKEVVISSGTLLLGTSPECGLALADPTVSRRHAALELLGRRVRVTDLESKNGTRYLGAEVQQMEVPVGAVLELGRTFVALLPPALPEGVASRAHALEGMLGRSLPMRRLFAEIEQVAASEAPVLVLGETGVGKERVAQAIHRLSPRASEPFQVFDCGSVQPELVQSALFGHVKGAFTGAVQDRPGALEAAHGGTLFLDEIAELPLELQPVLLRALETKTFSRVGEGGVRKSDFRIVAATHQDLEEAVAAKRFRADLYYRLSAIALRVPPLRERTEDIPLLVEHFSSARSASVRLDAQALTALCAHPWRGNVRELRNAVDRMAVLGPDSVLSTLAIEEPLDFHQARERALGSFEKGYLQSLLAQCNGSVSAAARKAGVARSYFYELLEKHGLGRKGRG